MFDWKSIISCLCIIQIDGNYFLDNEAIHSSLSGSEDEYKATKQDLEFIDDNSDGSQTDMNKVHEEHRRNLKRIAKNLDEFADCLTFEHSDLNSLKAFIKLLWMNKNLSSYWIILLEIVFWNVNFCSKQIL